MKRFSTRAMKMAALGALAVGTTFQASSCTVNENGVINALIDTFALSDLRTQLFESSPFADLFDRWHSGPDGGE